MTMEWIIGVLLALLLIAYLHIVAERYEVKKWKREAEHQKALATGWYDMAMMYAKRLEMAKQWQHRKN